MIPDREDFARWLDDPVTRLVLGAFALGAEEQKQAWIRTSWDNGAVNPALCQELRVRADAYQALSQMTYEDVCKQFGEEPVEG